MAAATNALGMRDDVVDDYVDDDMNIVNAGQNDKEEYKRKMARTDSRFGTAAVAAYGLIPASTRRLPLLMHPCRSELTKGVDSFDCAEEYDEYVDDEMEDEERRSLIRLDLMRIYSSYANVFPHPEFVRLEHERRAAAAAAAVAAAAAAAGEAEGRTVGAGGGGRGWLSRLLFGLGSGGGEGTEGDVASSTPARADAGVGGDDDDNDDDNENGDGDGDGGSENNGMGGEKEEDGVGVGVGAGAGIGSRNDASSDKRERLRLAELELELELHDLCGTSSIDTSAVPIEAIRMARLRLAAGVRRRPARLGLGAVPEEEEEGGGGGRGGRVNVCGAWIVCRTSTSYSSSSTLGSATWYVADWGVLAGFRPTPGNKGGGGDGIDSIDGIGNPFPQYRPSPCLTSDRDLLLNSLQRLEEEVDVASAAVDAALSLCASRRGGIRSHLGRCVHPDLSYVRAAQLGENCVAISWNLDDDGIVVLYQRRHYKPPRRRRRRDHHRRVRWSSREGEEGKGRGISDNGEDVDGDSNYDDDDDDECWEAVAAISPNPAVLAAAHQSQSRPCAPPSRRRRRQRRPPNNADANANGKSKGRGWWGGKRKQPSENKENGYYEEGEEEYDDDDAYAYEDDETKTLPSFSSPPPDPFEMGSFRVTDLAPLVIDPTEEEKEGMDAEEGIAAVTMLAISRLGGFVEFVSLPPSLCLGPALDGPPTPSPAEAQPSPSETARGRRSHQQGPASASPSPHLPPYARHLPDLSVPPPHLANQSLSIVAAAAISTHAYHDDAIALSVHRTDVGCDTEWDCSRYPDGPPAEFVVAVSGMKSRDAFADSDGGGEGRGGEDGGGGGGGGGGGAHPDQEGGDGGVPAGEEDGGLERRGRERQRQRRRKKQRENGRGGGSGECISLWSVTTVYTPSPEMEVEDATSPPEPERGGTFAVHVGNLGVVDLPWCGPDVTVLSDGRSGALLNRWKNAPSSSFLDGEASYASGGWLRNVRRRLIDEDDGRSLSSPLVGGEDRPVGALVPVAVSTPPPLVSLYFSSSPPLGDVGLSFKRQTLTPTTSSPPLLLAALDYAGGVTAFDCTSACRMATHSLSQEEEEMGVAIGVVLRREESLGAWGGNRRRGRNGSRSGRDADGDGDEDGAARQLAWWWSSGTTDVDHPIALTGGGPALLPLLAALRPGGVVSVWRLGGGGEDDGVAEGEGLSGPSVVVRHRIGSGACFLPSLAAESVGALSVLVTSAGRNGRSKGGGSGSGSVEVALLRPLDPADLVRSLLSRGSYREALKFANSVRNDDGVMDGCYRHLWESDRDVEALLRVRGDEYVVRTALSLGMVDAAPARERLSPEELRRVYADARGRAERMGAKVEAEVVRRRLVLLGTYLLLCRRFRSDSSIAIFYSHFLRKNDGDVEECSSTVLELARSFAVRGDISSLTLLCIRHPNQLGTNSARMSLLEELPLGLELSVWEHLLPCQSDPTDNDRSGSTCATLFGVRVPDRAGGLAESRESTEESQGVSLTTGGGGGLRFVGPVELGNLLGPRSLDPFFLDAIDEAAVNCGPKGSFDCVQDDSGRHEREILVRWYTSLARRMSLLSGTFTVAMRLCSAGLDRLCSHSNSEDQGVRNRTPELELIALRSSAHHLNRLSLDSKLSSTMEGITLEQFEALGVEGAVDLILGLDEDDEPGAWINRCRFYLVPMAAVDAEYPMISWQKHPEERNGGDGSGLEGTIRRALISRCLSAVQRAVSTKDENTTEALASCIALARASRTTLPRKVRMLQDERELMRFVIDSARMVCASGGTLSGGSEGSLSKGALVLLWELYETLPVRAEPLVTEDSEYAFLSAEVDDLFGCLIAMEMYKRWSLDIGIKHVFALFTSRATSKPENDGSPVSEERNVRLGLRFLSGMCDELCRRIGLPSVRNEPDRMKDIIFDFVSDLADLDEVTFQSALPLQTELQNRLVPELLHRQLFSAVNVLLQVKPGWFDMAFIHKSVARYSEEAIRDGGKDGILAAAACYEAFIDAFPNLRPEFDLTRRSIDAARFIKEVLRCNASHLTPSQIRSISPILVIDAVLVEKPFCVTSNFPRWAEREDPNFAIGANRAIAAYFARLDSSPLSDDVTETKLDARSLPPPPGEHVLQLGNILGLGNAEGRFCIRNKMVRRAVGGGFYGAAAALCQLLMRDAATLLGKKEGGASAISASDVAEHALCSIAAVVASDKYGDVGTRLELAVIALGLLSSSVGSKEGHDALGEIVMNLSILEAKTDAALASASMEAKASIAKVAIAHRKAISEKGSSANGSHNTSHVGVTGSLPSTNASSDPVGRNQAAESLVFKAASLVARQAKSMVGQQQKQQLDEKGGSNLFFSHESSTVGFDLEDMDMAFRQILETSSMDVRELLSTLQRDVVRGAEEVGSSGTDMIAKSPESAQRFAAIQSILKVLSRQLLSFCISESTKIRASGGFGKSKRADASTVGRVSAVVQLGTALLLEIRDADSVLSILDDLWDTFETEASAALEQLASQVSPSSTIADEEVVRQLQGRGYSANGSRRAAVMTNNEGFRPALTWAVAHFQDPNFDHPLVFVKGKNEHNGFLDQQLLSLVRRTLSKARGCVINRSNAKLKNPTCIEGTGKGAGIFPGAFSIEERSQSIPMLPPPLGKGKRAVENRAKPLERPETPKPALLAQPPNPTPFAHSNEERSQSVPIAPTPTGKGKRAAGNRVKPRERTQAPKSALLVQPPNPTPATPSNEERSQLIPVAPPPAGKGRRVVGNQAKRQERPEAPKPALLAQPPNPTLAGASNEERSQPIAVALPPPAGKGRRVVDNQAESRGRPKAPKPALLAQPPNPTLAAPSNDERSQSIPVAPPPPAGKGRRVVDNQAEPRERPEAPKPALLAQPDTGDGQPIGKWPDAEDAIAMKVRPPSDKSASVAIGTRLKKPPPPPYRPVANKLSSPPGKMKPPPPPPNRPIPSRSLSSPSGVAGTGIQPKSSSPVPIAGTSSASKGVSLTNVVGEASKLGSDERRRLAMEGRRLLEEARRSKGLSISSPMSVGGGSVSSAGSASPDDRRRLAMEGRRLLEQSRQAKDAVTDRNLPSTASAAAAVAATATASSSPPDEKKVAPSLGRFPLSRDGIAAAKRYESIRGSFVRTDTAPKEIVSVPSQLQPRPPVGASNEQVAKRIARETREAEEGISKCVPFHGGSIAEKVRVADGGGLGNQTMMLVGTKHDGRHVHANPTSNPNAPSQANVGAENGNRGSEADQGGWDFDDFDLDQCSEVGAENGICLDTPGQIPSRKAAGPYSEKRLDVAHTQSDGAISDDSASAADAHRKLHVSAVLTPSGASNGPVRARDGWDFEDNVASPTIANSSNKSKIVGSKDALEDGWDFDDF